MNSISAWWDRHQVPLDLCATGIGVLLGFIAPSTSPAPGTSIAPLLILLLFATFLGVSLTRGKQALSDRKFISTLLLTHFVAMPILVFIIM